MTKAFFSVMLTFYSVSYLTGQIDDQSVPFSFINSEAELFINRFNEKKVVLDPPNVASLLKEDQQGSIVGMPHRIGINLKANVDLTKEGTWITLANGDRICRLSFEADSAYALGLYFSQTVKIPEGATLHVFNQNKTKVLGAFKKGNDGFKALEMLPGDKLTLEYYEQRDVNATPMIQIEEVVYFYKGIDVSGLEINEKAENCQVDVLCSEGNGFSNQRRATVFYTYSLDGNTGSCTATMINNTSNNCTPYILSSAHCGLPESGSNISEWVWYWNYEKFSCQPGSANQTDPNLPSTTMSGGTVIASALNGTLDNGYGIPEIQGSDFVLVELDQRPPSNFDAYLAGWNRSVTIPANGKSIHHPSGSAKKIATTNNFSGDDYFWFIQWTSTSNGFGMMEPGSSGAAIFNATGQIVGNCSWSLPDICTGNQMDGFGKFSVSWADNGSAENAKLAPWLDPINSGNQFIDGRSNTCSTVGNENIELVDIKISPNPFSDHIKIHGENWLLLTVYDLKGKEIQLFRNAESGILELPQLDKGIYLFKLEMENGQTKIYRLLKE